MQKVKLMVASPCHNGINHSIFTISLIRSINHLASEKIETKLILQTTGSLLAYERNIMLHKFMQTDCTHILWIDSDIGWETDAPSRLLKHDKDIICGIYQTRQNDTKHFIFEPMLEDGMIKRENGLLRLRKCGFGFVLIKREAIERMQKHFPELYFDNMGMEGYGFFSLQNNGKYFMGEDYMFFHRAEEAGIEVWAEPNLTLNHAGRIANFSDILDAGEEKIVTDNYEGDVNV